MVFWEKYKKIFFIAGFILLVIVLGYLLYAAFLKPAPQPLVEANLPATTTSAGLPVSRPSSGQAGTLSIEPAGGLPVEPARSGAAQISQTAQGGVTASSQLTRQPGLSATLSANGSDLQYYNKTDGKFYRLTNDGQITALTDKIFYQAEKIIWSPTKNQAIITYPDNSNIIYDFAANKQITLPAHWQDFDYSPDGARIVMKSLGLDPQNRWLAIVNSDGSKAARLEALGDKNETVYPAWSPNNQIIAMYTEGIDFNRQAVYFVGLNNENFKSMTIEGRGFRPKWAPNGDKLLYSVYSSDNNMKPMLWLVNSSGDSIGSGRQSLNLETWADKCAFASNTELYCAVPENLEQGAGLFPELARNTKDNLYKIDLTTGAKKLIAVPDQSYNISEIIISQNGYNLYFTDETSGTIHGIKLK